MFWVDSLAVPVLDDFLLLSDCRRLTLPAINLASLGDPDSDVPDFLGLPMGVDASLVICVDTVVIALTSTYSY